MDKLFSKFNSVVEAELLNDEQLNQLEAGSKCEEGCKKACLPGNMNNSGSTILSGNKTTVGTEVEVEIDR